MQPGFPQPGQNILIGLREKSLQAIEISTFERVQPGVEKPLQ